MNSTLLSGRYELEEIVGTGGMSVVYRAWDMKLDREVAVKVLRPEYMADENFVHQFNHEARATSQMSHPNIVNMYDVGQDGETRFIVMEYIKGMTLKDVIRQSGPYKPQRAVQVALKILAAIDHAHKNHIVHRDIKPQNILVDQDGRIKVTDFGIARVVDSSAATAGGKNILGSVHYFSPEQAKGAVADEKSDLYSVGVVFYEMVTGRVPFDGETPMAIALKHINDQPEPASHFNPEVSVGLDEVIAKALEKDPSMRYKTAAEMATDLKRALKMPMGGFVSRKQEEAPQKEKAAAKKNASKSKSGKWISWTALILTVLLLGVVSWQAWLFYEKLQTRVHVPSLALNDVEDAQARLEDMGLTVVIEDVFSDDVVAGIVVSQMPEGGTLLYPGETVTLQVSLGREALDVPDVCGYARSEAAVILEEAGLSVGEIILEISDDVPVGSVIRQEPAADEAAQPFDEVTLYVSGECSVVPSLDTLTTELARSTLAASGLQLGEVFSEESDEYPGTVIGQSVPTGERVLWGTVVDVTVSATDKVLLFENYSAEINVSENGSVVHVLLSEGESEREVYRNTFNAGKYDLTLTLDSTEAGEHTVRVFIDDEQTIEDTVVFGEE